MLKVKCGSSHLSQVTMEQIEKGVHCPECGQNIYESNIVGDVVSSDTKEPPPKHAPATEQPRSESETDA